MAKTLKDCVNKDHSLKVVISHLGAFDESTVVRWCEVCGGVVVDIDCDGRTNPGAISSMQFPKCLTGG